MGKFRKHETVVDAHGNKYKVIEVESGTGRVAVKSTETREQSKVMHERDLDHA